jgi:hypothetical protein
MTESLLIDVREKQAEATRKALTRWGDNPLPRLKQARTRLARELSQLIAEHADRHAGDEEMIRKLVKDAVDLPPEQVDRINSFLQHYLSLVIGVSRLQRDIANKLAKGGHRVARAKSLDAIIAERERWREELPEQLALASRPVRSSVRKRVAQILQTPPRETDWRSLFK